MSRHHGNPRSANGARRRAVRARVLAAYDVCHLCGRPVDKSLPAGDPMAPEVDEIIPVSMGGSPTKFANLALAHRSCNEFRGNHSVAWARARLRGATTTARPTSLPLTHDEI